MDIGCRVFVMGFCGGERVVMVSCEVGGGVKDVI
jgi:hypothetical protein